MKIKWMNCLALIVFLFLIDHLEANKIQLSAELPSDLISFSHQDLWHPNLKRKWLDDKNYVMYDNRRKIYPTSLVQLQSDSFLTDESTKTKMKCGCRFIKQDVVNKLDTKSLINNSSFLETNTQVKALDGNINNNSIPVNSYFEHFEEKLKESNVIMTKIEHFLENQQMTNIQIGMKNGMLTNNNRMGVISNPYLMMNTNNPQLNPQFPLMNTVFNQVPMPMMNAYYPQNGQVFNSVNNPQISAQFMANSNPFTSVAF